MSLSHPSRLEVRFRGVRGSIPAPGPATCGVGGNTTCLEIAAAGLHEALVFDAGSGIRALGHDLLHRGTRRAHVVFTHFHWDHVQGLPFFLPLFRPDVEIGFHAACPAADLRDVLERQMRPPYFPVALDAAASRKSYAAVAPAGLALGPVDIRPFPLRHPQPCSGYRISAGGATVVFATDTELGDRELDAALLDHCRGADVLICDAQNTPGEEAARRGWGHSSWRQAAAMAARADVGELVLFHHDPERTDAQVEALAAAARADFPRTRAAREGEVLSL